MNLKFPSLRSHFSWYTLMILHAFRAVIYYWPAMASLAPNRNLVRILLFGYILLLCYVLAVLRQALYRKRLQTKGPYSFVAHPAYTSYLVFDLVFLLGLTPLTTVNILSFFAFAFCLFHTSHKEEQRLIHRFGEEARSYLTRTPSLYSFRSLFRKSSE